MALKILDFSSKRNSYSHYPPTKQEAESWMNWLRKKSAESEAKRKAEVEETGGKVYSKEEIARMEKEGSADEDIDEQEDMHGVDGE